MRFITALLHTQNDGRRIGRALETLYACDEILIVDHGSTDGTVDVAREYGAKVVEHRDSVSPEQSLTFAAHEWILTLGAHESLSESLSASLYEWKVRDPLETDAGSAFSVFLREETANGWTSCATPQTRLVPRAWKRWSGKFPAHAPSALALEGELLRFSFP